MNKIELYNMYKGKQEFVGKLSDLNYDYPIYGDQYEFLYDWYQPDPEDVAQWERVVVKVWDPGYNRVIYTFFVNVNCDSYKAILHDIEDAIKYYEQYGEYEQ